MIDRDEADDRSSPSRRDAVYGSARDRRAVRSRRAPETLLPHLQAAPGGRSGSRSLMSIVEAYDVIARAGNYAALFAALRGKRAPAEQLTRDTRRAARTRSSRDGGDLRAFAAGDLEIARPLRPARRVLGDGAPLRLARAIRGSSGRSNHHYHDRSWRRSVSPSARRPRQLRLRAHPFRLDVARKAPRSNYVVLYRYAEADRAAGAVLRSSGASTSPGAPRRSDRGRYQASFSVDGRGSRWPSGRIT